MELTMPMRSRRGERGLTLVELLISLALLSFILLGIAPLFLSSVKANYAGNEYTSIHNMARDRLEQLMALPFNAPQLEPGIHQAGAGGNLEVMRAQFLPQPLNPTALSTVRNPYTIGWKVEQWRIPLEATIATGAAFTPVPGTDRITVANQPFDYKAIFVRVTTDTTTLGIGRRVGQTSGMLTNPNITTFLSLVDPVAGDVTTWAAPN
jgi:prepilin-type N-terminal cleavage/methylation domain-containing protein